MTPSEERNHRGSRYHKTVRQSSPASSHVCPDSYEGRTDSLIIVCRQVKSPEDAYMTLDPKSRCSEYDTLDVSYSAVVVKVLQEILFVMHMFTSCLEYEEIL